MSIGEVFRLGQHTHGDDINRFYDGFGRTYLFDIDFFHIKTKDKLCIDAYHAGNVSMK